jgi:hypothetical protein
VKFIASGAAREDCFHVRVDTESSNSTQANHCQMIEVILAPLDAPKSVLLTGAAIDEFNKQKAVVGT